MFIFNKKKLEFITPSTKASISNLVDAISHYRGGSGEMVPADDKLIEEMIENISFKIMSLKLYLYIRRKITNEAINKKEIIKAAPESRRGAWCLTLGSYSVNIDYSLVPKVGFNVLNIRFYGYDTWDFEYNENKSRSYNLVEEVIPSWIAGEGKPFNVTYDFYVTGIIYKSYLSNLLSGRHETNDAVIANASMRQYYNPNFSLFYISIFCIIYIYKRLFL